MTLPLKDALETYIDRGWCPIPIPFRSKAPIVKGWPDLKVRLEELASYLTLPP